MTAKTANPYLTGQLLIAMPSMADPRFHRAVIYVCVHDDKGAMGLGINTIYEGMHFADMLDQLELEKDTDKTPDPAILKGGPVDASRGFVLHSPDFTQPDTIAINDHFNVTGTVESLQLIAEGQGPDKMLFILGYAGWDAAQLDREMQDNAWLTLLPDYDLVFDTPAEEKWDKAIRRIGIDPVMLSSTAGRA